MAAHEAVATSEDREPTPIAQFDIQREADMNASRKRGSTFNIATQQQVVGDETTEQRNARILKRRGAFKWLHVAFTNDLVYGSWYYIVGSILSMLVPVFPLIGLEIINHFFSFLFLFLLSLIKKKKKFTNQPVCGFLARQRTAAPGSTRNCVHLVDSYGDLVRYWVICVLEGCGMHL